MRQLEPNAIKNITPHIIPVPRGIDMVTKSLQTSFDGLEWLEKSFARAVFQSKVVEDLGEYTFPAVFVQDGFDFLDLMLNDNWKSYSFMIARDGEKIEDYQEGVQNVITRKLSCIFWMNLQRIDETRRDDFLEELKQDVLKAIKNTSFRESTNGASVLGVSLLDIFDEPKNIFDSFTFNTDKTQALYYPYRGLRIDLDCLYREECP